MAAIQAGQPVILPTDTVYGLCASPYSGGAASRIYRLKRRPETRPLALVASDVDMLLELLPELRGRAGRIVRELLPGPYTLVVPNPGRRYRWLSGSNPGAIGVRVPSLEGPAATVLARVGAVTATSANLSGEADARRLDEVPDELKDACAAVVDGGELPGTPSTVVDVTGPRPRVLREGAVSSDEALSRLLTAVC
ncbi:MAG: L-threonylcarbamoyladenylate synthase [Actinomycetota bacterium]|nr:L-threonylcarbamoyladenylate synthase [Actinomycetota bacterium]